MRTSPTTFTVAALAVGTTFAIFAAALATLAGPDLAGQAGMEPGPARTAMSIARGVLHG